MGGWEFDGEERLLGCKRAVAADVGERWGDGGEEGGDVAAEGVQGMLIDQMGEYHGFEVDCSRLLYARTTKHTDVIGCKNVAASTIGYHSCLPLLHRLFHEGHEGELVIGLFIQPC